MKWFLRESPTTSKSLKNFRRLLKNSFRLWNTEKGSTYARLCVGNSQCHQDPKERVCDLQIVCQSLHMLDITQKETKSMDTLEKQALVIYLNAVLHCIQQHFSYLSHYFNRIYILAYMF